MAKTMGFSSPNFVKLVIDGERNIGKDSLPKIIDALGLKKKEAEYFSYLVFFAQAKNSIDKNYYFGLIASFRSQSIITKLNTKYFDFFNNWYNVVIRELINEQHDPIDYEKFAARIYPSVSVSNVKKSVALLLELGIIEKNSEGRYIQSAPILNTDNEVQSLALKNFHDSMIGLAQKALHEVPSMDREIASLTVKISSDGFSALKKRLQDFREELLQIVQEDTNVDKVYQVNFQMFPVSKGEKEHEN
jgi:uncharacterized protein (TIGR02147 family)